MAQATLDDDELFGEAADELKAEVATALDAAADALPSAEEVWEPAGDNLLGQLNTLKSALAAEDAHEHLREAKKGIALGRRSGALEEGDELMDRMTGLESRIEALVEAREAVGALTATLPELRQHLQAD